MIRSASAGNCGLTAIDLFSGAGGATQGLKEAGYQVLAAIENDPAASRTYNHNHPEVVPLFFDIRDVDAVALRDALGLRSGQLSLLKACPPCQGFSTLGRGGDDPRNDLVREVERFIDAFAPAVWVLENVRGLAKDHRLDQLRRHAREAGYTVASFSVDAADFGVPQHRSRLIVIGSAKLCRFPERLQDLLTSPITKRSAGDALAQSSDLDGPPDPLHRWRRLSTLSQKRVEAIPIGGGRFDLPEELRLRCHQSVGRSAASPYGRIRADRPAPTMTTRCTTPACGRFVHPTENRGISLREAALLQTFPPDYAFEGTYGEIERQIGNAVPVALARALGMIVVGLTDSTAVTLPIHSDLIR